MLKLIIQENAFGKFHGISKIQQISARVAILIKIYKYVHRYYCTNVAFRVITVQKNPKTINAAGIV